MNKNEIIQGQTMSVSVSISEIGQSISSYECAIGIYGSTGSDKIILKQSDGSLEKIDDTHFVAVISHETTRKMKTGPYTLELLVKINGTYRAIGNPMSLYVIGSNIGMEEV